MNLHEYQAKELLAKYGLPVQQGILAATPEEAAAAYDKLGGKFAVVKAQVHAGGRGKAGGVKVVKSREEAAEVAKGLIGKNLVTYQTDAAGQPVNSVLVCEDMYPVQRELYLGAVVDRGDQRVVFMVSTEGGVEIEKVAEETPEKIIKIEVDPLVGMQPFQARDAAFALELKGEQVAAFTKLMLGSYKAFVENDFALFEVNPLALRENGQLACVDGKINLDSNALYRHPELLAQRDKSQENEREVKASEFDLNYVALEGNIGCMVNGAGLAMATMDIIKLKGGQPANFLDVGGGATKERVIEAFADPGRYLGAGRADQHLRRHRALRHDRRGHHRRGEGSERDRAGSGSPGRQQRRAGRQDPGRFRSETDFRPGSERRCREDRRRRQGRCLRPALS